MTTQYDVVVIGGGPGGYVAAIRAAQAGRTVALVEKERVGGTCLNRGCIPTKAMVRDAELYRDAASGEFCVQSESGFAVDWQRLMARKAKVVETLVDGVRHLLDQHGVTRYDGTGRLLSPTEVEITAGDGAVDQIAAGAVILATGSVPARAPIPGVELEGVLTSRELLEIDHQPESIIVIGGSVVGIEFASILHALGTRVTVLGRKSFLRDAEQRLAKRYRSMLTRSGVKVQIGVQFEEITRAEDGTMAVHYARRGKTQVAEAEMVLLSTGRWPYTKGLGLEALGVSMNGRAIAVDQHLQTSLPGVYAIGDCIGGYMLAHVASYEAEVAVDNILGEPRMVDYTVVPNCIFAMPEIADVGLTEAHAREQGLDYVIVRFPFGVSGRAVAMGEGDGQVRMVCARDETGGKVLGVHIMGPHASDLIAEASLAMQLGATAKDIANTIHAHPTVPEALMEAAMTVGRGAIHFQKR